MSKVLPAKQFQLNHCNDLEDVCPRYQKWMKRITKGDNGPKKGVVADKSSSSNSRSYMNLFSKRLSKRKRSKSKDANCSESATCDLNGKPKEKPLRSKSIFFRIRQKGRNFGIRCKTSVELWRKWIKRGIHGWDRSPPKPADIDIINKPESKLKDFHRKSIINEVILEEDEEDNVSNVSRPKVTDSNGNNNNNLSQGGGRDGKDKSPERNFLTELSYIQRASNLFRTTKARDEPVENMAKNAINEAPNSQQHSNGQVKYPMQDLASMDIGRIEKINSSEDERTNGAKRVGGDAPNSSKSKASPPHGAIHRAFNKLKLFF